MQVTHVHNKLAPRPVQMHLLCFMCVYKIYVTVIVHTCVFVSACMCECKFLIYNYGIMYSESNHF